MGSKHVRGHGLAIGTSRGRESIVSPRPLTRSRSVLRHPNAMPPRLARPRPADLRPAVDRLNGGGPALLSGSTRVQAMDTDAKLRRANVWAQLCFHEMLELGCYGDAKAPATIRYIAAERRVDDLLRDAQWEAAKTAMDALITADLWSEPELREAFGR